MGEWATTAIGGSVALFNTENPSMAAYVALGTAAVVVAMGLGRRVMKYYQNNRMENMYYDPIRSTQTYHSAVLDNRNRVENLERDIAVLISVNN